MSHDPESKAGKGNFEDPKILSSGQREELNLERQQLSSPRGKARQQIEQFKKLLDRTNCEPFWLEISNLQLPELLATLATTNFDIPTEAAERLLQVVHGKREFDQHYFVHSCLSGPQITISEHRQFNLGQNKFFIYLNSLRLQNCLNDQVEIDLSRAYRPGLASQATLSVFLQPSEQNNRWEIAEQLLEPFGIYDLTSFLADSEITFNPEDGAVSAAFNKRLAMHLQLQECLCQQFSEYSDLEVNTTRSMQHRNNAWIPDSIQIQGLNQAERLKLYELLAAERLVSLEKGGFIDQALAIASGTKEFDLIDISLLKDRFEVPFTFLLTRETYIGDAEYQPFNQQIEQLDYRENDFFDDLADEEGNLAEMGCQDEADHCIPIDEFTEQLDQLPHIEIPAIPAGDDLIAMEINPGFVWSESEGGFIDLTEDESRTAVFNRDPVIRFIWDQQAAEINRAHDRGVWRLIHTICSLLDQPGLYNDIRCQLGTRYSQKEDVIDIYCGPLLLTCQRHNVKWRGVMPG